MGRTEAILSTALSGKMQAVEEWMEEEKIDVWFGLTNNLNRLVLLHVQQWNKGYIYLGREKLGKIHVKHVLTEPYGSRYVSLE